MQICITDGSNESSLRQANAHLNENERGGGGLYDFTRSICLSGLSVTLELIRPLFVLLHCTLLRFAHNIKLILKRPSFAHAPFDQLF